LTIAPGRDDQAKYHCLRLLADLHNGGSPHQVRAKSIDIYLYLLRTGMACMAGGPGAIDVKHNLASDLIGLGYKNAAALLWESIYSDGAGDDAIRRGFGNALGEVQLMSAAAAVLIGQALPPLKLEAEVLPFPFAVNVDHWWERLSVGTYPPCSVPSFLNLGPEGP
jgi:hypothetical protein